MPDRLDISGWSLRAEETAGRTAHAWYARPGDDRFWLFKTTDEDEHRPFGEDMAELVASQVARVMGVPAALVELAERDDKVGCVVRDLRPSKWSYEAGSELLAGRDPDYSPPQSNTVNSIVEALSGVGPSSDSASAIKSAAGAFAGMLVLDALIANTDRHENNWHVLSPPPGQEEARSLCGAFDHGSALGFNESEEKKREILYLGRSSNWAEKGKARQFARSGDGKVISLVQLAAEMLAAIPAVESAFWVSQLEKLTDHGIITILDVTVSQTSSVSYEFVKQLILVNRDRLLETMRVS